MLHIQSSSPATAAIADSLLHFVQIVFIGPSSLSLSARHGADESNEDDEGTEDEGPREGFRVARSMLEYAKQLVTVCVLRLPSLSDGAGQY